MRKSVQCAECDWWMPRADADYCVDCNEWLCDLCLIDHDCDAALTALLDGALRQEFEREEAEKKSRANGDANGDANGGKAGMAR